MLKSKKGYLRGLQIRELIEDVKIEDQLSEVEKAAWKSFQNVNTSFLGNSVHKTICDMVADLVRYYKVMVFKGAFLRL